MAESRITRTLNGPSPDGASPRRLRVAILATPRSGNTWLRSLLGSLYGLQDVVCDRPDEVPWDELPERCVLQLHWSPDSELLDRLRRRDVRAVTIARHPLDVLISILHFCTTWPGTARWFGGRGGTEGSIHGALPTSDVFRNYAISPRAAALLSISRDWRQVADCHKLCYEDLVGDPERELGRLTANLEHVPLERMREAIAGNSLEQLKPRVQNQHYWRGDPGHWKRLLPAAAARLIAGAHAAVFEDLGYDCTPDESLTLAIAENFWFALEIMSLREELCRTRRELVDSADRLRETECRMVETRRMVARLEPLCELGPRAIRVAQGLHACAAGHRDLLDCLARWLRVAPRKAG